MREANKNGIVLTRKGIEFMAICCMLILVLSTSMYSNNVKGDFFTVIELKEKFALGDTIRLCPGEKPKIPKEKNQILDPARVGWYNYLATESIDALLKTKDENGVVINTKTIHLLVIDDGTCDVDYDGIMDQVDTCLNSYENEDRDGDGICDFHDNCPAIANADQKDTDKDDIGDVCDRDGINDRDDDGVVNSLDNCISKYNPFQEDHNQNGIGDFCEDSSGDSDYDKIPDSEDPCPQQRDNIDYDNDGICDYTDNCVLEANPDQIDSDGDGFGDVCDIFDNRPKDTDKNGIADKLEDKTKDSDGDGILDYLDEEDSNPCNDFKVSVSPVSLALCTSGEGHITVVDYPLNQVIDQCRVVWSTGESTHQVSVSKAGLYTATVTDTHGCTSTVSCEVSSKPDNDGLKAILKENGYLFVKGSYSTISDADKKQKVSNDDLLTNKCKAQNLSFEYEGTSYSVRDVIEYALSIMEKDETLSTSYYTDGFDCSNSEEDNFSMSSFFDAANLDQSNLSVYLFEDMAAVKVRTYLQKGAEGSEKILVDGDVNIFEIYRYYKKDGQLFEKSFMDFAKLSRSLPYEDMMYGSNIICASHIIMLSKEFEELEDKE